MPTLTSDLTPAPDGAPGLPDAATLARMANAFFNALPGAVPALDSTFAPAQLTPDIAGANVPAGATDPRTAAPGAAIPGNAFPAGATSGAAIPSSAIPGGMPSTTAIPTSSFPGAAVPGPAGASGVGIPGTTIPGAGIPGAGIPGISIPSAGIPGVSILDATIPSAGIPGATIPGAGSAGPSIPGATNPRTAVGPPPSSPGAPSAFYFLDYAGSGWDSLSGSAAATLDNLAALSAQPPSALPIGADLGMPRSPPTTLAGLPGGAPSFYFLDPTPDTADIRALQGADQHPPFNVAAIRRDFPILSERVNGRPLIWLDNAATTQKPQAVIDRLVKFYSHENSNIHRAAHELAARATDAYEGARATAQRFLGASSPQEIVFVRGATEAINLVAQSWGRQNILSGDEIIVSHLEHHANIVPWQQLASEKGARLRVIPVDDSGQILLDEYQKLLNSRTKLVSVTQVSNALGTIVPVREVTDLAHRAGARVLIDGAQAVSHMPVDVRSLGADFYVFSGHKVFGPTGIGVLYGTAEVLESMPPWQGGGNMIASVTFERTTYQKPPGRFEAGTGNIADAAGLAAALDYITRLGMANIDRYEHDLLSYATAALQSVPGLRLIGTAREKASVLSFVLDGHDPVAVGHALNEEGIAVRAGHHCAEPILHRFGVTATVRPSLAFYNTCEEVDVLAAALHRLATRSGRK
jgi:cysteine desulfurase/selenocysteine lyase